MTAPDKEPLTGFPTPVASEPVFSWCPMCLTSAHYRVDFSLIFDNGMIPNVVYQTGCMRCDPPRPWTPPWPAPPRPA